MEENPALTIAVVDDDPSICRAMLRLLRAEGFRATAYASAENFLAAPEHHGFDCLVLDVQLGGMSGLELQQHLTSSGAVFPIIFVSAHSELEYREQALRAGCVAYLRKTDPGASVLNAIRQATEHRDANKPAA